MILLAGGSGRRMSAAAEDKLFLFIGPNPLLFYTLNAIQQSGVFQSLVVVYRDNRQRDQIQQLLQQMEFSLPVQFAQGGAERQNSVAAGLAVLDPPVSHVAIHDGARAAIHPFDLKRIRQQLEIGSDCLGLASKVTDTVRRFNNDPTALPGAGLQIDRTNLWAMQTPQAFSLTTIQRAHAALKSSVTDDLAACEAIGIHPQLIESHFPNPKMTSPADIPLFEKLLNPRGGSSDHRIGFGYDIHRCVKGRPLILGGVRIPCEFGLEGHSDADVLLHALADAILGAIGERDIGYHFPPTDLQWKDMDSILILEKAADLARQKGFTILNLDATLIAESPRINPFVEEMKSRIGEALELRPQSIGIKATTHEKLGPIGRGEGIAAQAVALLRSQGT